MMDYRYNRKKGKKKQKEYSVIYNQLVVCLVAIIVVLFSRLIFNDGNKSFDTALLGKLSENISLEDLNEKVISVFSQNEVIGDILNGDIQGVFNNSEEKEDIYPTFETDVLTYERA